MRVAPALLALGPVFCQVQSSGKSYAFEFTEVVDSTNGFNSIGSFPAINNHGEVAFRAASNGGTEGIFRAGQALDKLATIASTSDGLSFFGDDVAINPGGVVVFDATTASNSHSIYKGDGRSKILIADSMANGLSRIGVAAPSINASGNVAFSATLAQRGSPVAVFTGNGGPLTTVLSTSATGFSGFQNVAINDRGTIVFSASLRDGSSGVFTASDALVDIVDTNRKPEIASFGDPVINSAGVVADVAFLVVRGAPEIFTGTARGVTARNDPSNPPFTNSEHPSINNSGAVAFSAIPNFAGDTAPTGIFLEVSGGQSLIPVIRPGDKLFGSIVDHVDLGRFALNDRFQMVFSYTLTDGRSGIAIASYNGERGDENPSH
ncbi:MAG TPA: choice-of-anchor tandem repeat NxxGxxAF-containing protein [Candidatus Acidoferrales bacterium]|nr:choice-of-anchor tandem repeat NxxGxxAF-containing protein [Candidatus Acidoferrales bacterium]